MTRLAFGVAVVVLGSSAARAQTDTLRFTQVTGDSLRGRVGAIPVQVSALTAAGSLDTAFSAAVTVGLGGSPDGAHLSGTTTVNAQSGVASFTDLVIDKDVSNLTLTASSPGLTAASQGVGDFTAASTVSEAVGCSSASASGLALLLLFAAALAKRKRRLLLVLCFVGFAGSAATQEDREAVRELNKQGLAQLSAGKYDEAIATFEAARARIDASALVYNLAETHRRAGHCEKAVDLYELYLKRVPDPAKRSDTTALARLECPHARAAPPAPVAPPVVAKPAPAPVAPPVVAKPAPAPVAPPVVAKRAPAPVAPPVVAKPAPAPVAPPVVVAAPTPAPPPVVAPVQVVSAPPPAVKERRAGPELSGGISWDPADKAFGGVAMIGWRFSAPWTVAAGVQIAKHPGVRVSLERVLFETNLVSLSLAARGLFTAFPESAFVAGGGLGLSFRLKASDNLDVFAAAYGEGYFLKNATGYENQSTFAPIFTAGVALHL
jgi:tetratricopeptide (TPR) repeat protein